MHPGHPIGVAFPSSTAEVSTLVKLAAAHRVHHDRNGAPYGMLVPVLSRSTRSGSRPSQVPLDA